MTPTTITYQFNGPNDATLTIEAYGIPEAMVEAEGLVQDADQWYAVNIGMNLGTFLKQARAMFAPVPA